MAILGKFYNADTRTDEVWYDSSNIYYSKFIEDENENKGDLYVTFKNGWTYRYKDVDMPTDYILFKHGGIDNSQGKTFNKIIKPKYEYERLEDANMSLLQESFEKLMSKQQEENPPLVIEKTVGCINDFLGINGKSEVDMTDEERMLFFNHIAERLPSLDEGWFNYFLS